jgi:uncharacterized membrane protein YphA (DoxX/SURF4 family)
VFTVLSIVFAAVCFVPATAKLAAHPRIVASADHFGIPWPRYRLIGVAELLAAAGVLLGLAWPPIGIAAALGMIVLLIGALVTHHRSGDPVQVAAPAIVSVIVAVAYLAAALAR